MNNDYNGKVFQDKKRRRNLAQTQVSSEVWQPTTSNGASPSSSMPPASTPGAGRSQVPGRTPGAPLSSFRNVLTLEPVPCSSTNTNPQFQWSIADVIEANRPSVRADMSNAFNVVADRYITNTPSVIISNPNATGRRSHNSRSNAHQPDDSPPFEQGTQTNGISKQLQKMIATQNMLIEKCDAICESDSQLKSQVNEMMQRINDDSIEQIRVSLSEQYISMNSMGLRQLEVLDTRQPVIPPRILNLTNQLNIREEPMEYSSTSVETSNDSITLRSHSNSPNNSNHQPPNATYRYVVGTSNHTLANSSAYKRKPGKKRKAQAMEKEDHPDNHGGENDVVIIGKNNTLVRREVLLRANWKQPKKATRNLLDAVFNREILGTHSLTGKESPAFKGRKPIKFQLPEKPIEDIIFYVNKRTGAPKSMIKNSITTKCADETKMLQHDLKKLKQKEDAQQTQNAQPTQNVGAPNAQSPTISENSENVGSQENVENAQNAENQRNKIEQNGRDGRQNKKRVLKEKNREYSK